jgi:glycosyltransferase involved in cell wall biosynthesis
MSLAWALFIGAVVVCLSWYGVRLFGLWRAKKRFCLLPHQLESRNNTGLSVIVAAHNAKRQLPMLLAALAEQTYTGTFEVWVVDDRSTDGTNAFLKNAEGQYPWLRALTIESTPQGWSPKKWALTQGIAAAKYERLAFTDADCTPEPDWLSSIVGAFELGYDIVLGYSPVVPRITWLNYLQQLEGYKQATTNLAFTALGLPVTATGRSLAYTQDIYKRAGGFAAHKHVLSGDDDILVTQIGRKAQVYYMLSPTTWVYTSAKTSYQSWFRARVRHQGASSKYSTAVQLVHIWRHVAGLALVLGPGIAWYLLPQWIATGALLPLLALLNLPLNINNEPLFSPSLFMNRAYIGLSLVCVSVLEYWFAFRAVLTRTPRW